MAVRMTATKGFTNARVTGPRPDGAVRPGDTFTTDWVHGQELRQLGLAEPDDADAFDAEPVEMMQPHNQISEAELRRVNARRRQIRGARPAAMDLALSRPTTETGRGETAADLDTAPGAPLGTGTPSDTGGPAGMGTPSDTGGPTDMGTLSGTGVPASIAAAPASALKSNAPAIPPAPGAAA